MKRFQRQFLILAWACALAWLLPASVWSDSVLPDADTRETLAWNQAATLASALSTASMSDLSYLNLQYAFFMQAEWYSEIATTVDITIQKQSAKYDVVFSLSRPRGVNLTGKIGLFIKRLFPDDDFKRMLDGIQTRLYEELSLSGGKFTSHHFIQKKQSIEKVRLTIESDLIHMYGAGDAEYKCPPIVNTGQETPLAGFLNYCFFDNAKTDKHIISILKEDDKGNIDCDLTSKILPIMEVEGQYRYALLLSSGYSFLNLIYGDHVYFNLTATGGRKFPYSVYLKGLKSQTRTELNRDKIAALRQKNLEPAELEKRLRPLMLAAWDVHGYLLSAEYRSATGQLTILTLSSPPPPS